MFEHEHLLANSPTKNCAPVCKNIKIIIKRNLFLKLQTQSNSDLNEHRKNNSNNNKICYYACCFTSGKNSWKYKSLFFSPKIQNNNNTQT